MALPTTGSLSGDQIDKEFPDSVDGGRPMRLGEYSGVRASKNGVAYNLPGPGLAISYSSFRGVSAGYFIDVLIVGSGGGGGTPDTDSPNGGNCGGGGGGGFAQIVNNLFVIPGQEYAIVVGGVDGVIQNGVPGANGKSSSFTHDNVTYVSLGGGGGGGGDFGNQNNRRGRNGGCGGGQGNTRVNDPTTLYGEPIDGTCQLNTTPRCRGYRGGGSRLASAISCEAGGGGGVTSEGELGYFSGSDPNPPPNSNGSGGFGIGLGFLNGARFNVSSESNRTKEIDGFGGGGGGGRSVTISLNTIRNSPESVPQSAAFNGGGRGTNPFVADNILDRDGYNRTGGGGGGGSRYTSGDVPNGPYFNGAGVGGTGVVIVRYFSPTGSTLDGMGDVDGNPDPNINVTRRNGNPDNRWKYLIFGRNTRHSNSLNLTFRA